MKLLARILIPVLGIAVAHAAEEITYTNYIRQFQSPSGVTWDVSAAVASFGSQPSDLAINPGGARFELWTVANTTPPGWHPLDTAYVGTYVPVATVAIRSEDPYTLIPRTRADRPFFVDIEVSGLLNGATDPPASKSVKLTRHVQSYGAGGDGINININRSQATLLSQAYINANGTHPLTYTLTSVPGADRSKVRGEERFTIFSIEDNRVGTDGLTYVVPETQIASKFIQIWPVADATLSGITQGQVVRAGMPPVTLELHDLYPSSTTYAQVYRGDPQLGTTGTVVPGSSLVVDGSVPQSPPAMILRDYDAIFNADGRWTMEVLTSTPFGIDRLAVVSFDVERTLQVNGALTTIE